MELKIVIDGQVQGYKGKSKKSCILKCLEKNANLSERFFANKALLPALEMDRDFNKHEVETAFNESAAAEGLQFEWVIPNGGDRKNAGRKSQGYKMVSIRMTEDEKIKVKAFLKTLRSQKYLVP